MEDKDEIIEEIPVYLSKALVDNLFILQYPNKNDFNFENAEVVKSCIKPTNQDIKVDYALNTASKHYDAFKGEQFAIAADGQKNNRIDKPSFYSGTMDRQSYISTKPMENINKYILGIYQDKEIHATSITGILQMRPSFSYFDKSDKRTKAEQKAENEADLEEEEATQITVKFARTENDSIRKAREKTFNFITQKSADEAWCETMWYTKDSKEAELERQKLFSTASQSTSNALSLSGKEYIGTLIPPEKANISIEALLPTNVISKNKLKEMSLSDQIQVILRDAKVVNFDRLMELLADKTVSTDKVLRTLPSVGILVQGNWIVLSEILYPTDSVSGTNGVPAELMCRARDYILYQFTKNEIIDRTKISQTTQIPADEVKDILLTVAKFDKQNRWTLLAPPDHTFEQKYQELKQRQEIYWKAKEANFHEMEAEKSPKRQRKRSIREVNSK